MPIPRSIPRMSPMLCAMLGVACFPGEPASSAPASTPWSPASAAATGSASPAPGLSPPVDAALPERPAVPALRARQTCWPGKHVCCQLEPPEGALSPDAPVALWEVSLEKGACVQARREGGVELFGVLLEGSAGLRCEDHPAGCPPLEKPYAAFRVPGGGLRLTARAPTRLIIGMATADGLPLEARAPGGPAGAQAGAPEVFSFSERPDLAWGGGAFHARIGWGASLGRSGSSDAGVPERAPRPAAVLSTLRFSGGAAVAEHEHPASWECIVVLEGGGELARREGDEPPRLELLGPGDVACVAPGEKHAFSGSGGAPFTALQVYAPPGPEQRFKTLAAAAPEETPR